MSSFTDSLQAQIDNLKAENKALREQGGEMLRACEYLLLEAKRSKEWNGAMSKIIIKNIDEAISNATGLKKERG